MHTDELWQAYNANGERISGGYDAALGNPKNGASDVYVGAASVWLYRHVGDEIEILFQQRAPQISNGGKWDVSAGGHINDEEATVAAAVRELSEEIGVTVAPEDLEFIFRLKTFFKIQMFINYYICDWTGKPEDFHFADGEVSQVKWVKLSEFDDFVDKYAKQPIVDAHFTRELAKFWLGNKYGNPQK